jgi:hypothetical protein
MRTARAAMGGMVPLPTSVVAGIFASVQAGRMRARSFVAKEVMPGLLIWPYARM